MAVYKCKMCGGDLEIGEGNVAVCEYCGTKQTVPTLDNERKESLFGRAGRLLRACEFDKASVVFGDIVSEFPDEAEAYWGLLLCKYGVEYVDDPATGKKIPTCHRLSFNSVMEDADFEQALENADYAARGVYREEAKFLEELRRNVIEVSAKEEPYDVFICYKETDANGDRTIDSVMAQDIYNELTEKGLKVFFARITLEDKLGMEYEPYIFAALNSAKVMLAIGTDYEYFNAVWVKNEWSRFLKLMANGEKKVLIPCYKGIDAYDMPKEFRNLQAQDMGKLGFMQDLIRGVEKIIGSNTNTNRYISNSTDIVADTVKRAYSFILAKDWESAKKCIDTVLGYDPHNVEALVGCLMCKYKITEEKQFFDIEIILEKDDLYQKIIEIADISTKEKVQNYNKASIYNCALLLSNKSNESSLRKASEMFESISDWKDSKKQIEIIKRKKQILKRKKFRMFSVVFGMAAIFVSVALFLYLNSNYFKPLKMYNSALDLMKQEKYVEAIDAFSQNPDFEDSKNMIVRCKYIYANELTNEEKYEEADIAFAELTEYILDNNFSAEDTYFYAQNLFASNQLENSKELFEALEDYKDSNSKKQEVSNEIEYRKALDAMDKADTPNDWDNVKRQFELLSEYKDSKQLAMQAQYKKGEYQYEKENFAAALTTFYDLKNDGYIESETFLSKIEKEIYDKAKEEYEATNWGTAKKWFLMLSSVEYKDSSEMAAECDNNIKRERNKYNGIWIEINHYWTNIKIDENGVYFASDTNYKRGLWEKTGSYSYDADSAKLTFTYWDGNTYEVRVNGDTMTLKWLNPIDQWDSDWFGDFNMFYKR